MESLLNIRDISQGDDARIAEIIRCTLVEFSANKNGFAFVDPGLDKLSEIYSLPRSRYWVVSRGSEVMGGGGIGPLQGLSESWCEIQKMYFDPSIRGLGAGRTLLEKCLQSAREFGFSFAYIETLERMQGARALYESFGFKKTAAPKGNTGHFGCDCWYELKLRPK